jgi:hypothetical protein
MFVQLSRKWRVFFFLKKGQLINVEFDGSNCLTDDVSQTSGFQSVPWGSVEKFL